MIDFSNRLVYITGGASGIGLETGRQLAELGAHIIVLDYKLNDGAMKILEGARRSPGQRTASYQLDVSNRQQVIDVMAKAVEECGTPDVLINSAGIAINGEFIGSKFEDFDRVMQVNLYGTRHVCEAVVPYMVKRNRGHIMLVSSMGGVVAIYGYTNYSTSKFAVRGFAEALRYELKPLGISVQCVCPGEVDTPMVSEEHKNMHPATWALKKTADSISVEAAVKDLVSGLRRDSPFIVTGFKTRLMFWIHRLTPPSLWYWLTDRLVAKALKDYKPAK